MLKVRNFKMLVSLLNGIQILNKRLEVHRRLKLMYVKM